jgi:adenine deaminase
MFESRSTYGLDVGLLLGAIGDFIVVNNLTDFKVQQTYINSTIVAENGKSLIQSRYG